MRNISIFRAIYLNNLAIGLRDRYNCTGDLADLQQAIELSQQAVALVSEDAPNHSRSLNNLAGGLLAHYDRTVLDIQQAIEWARSLNNLAGGLHDRYKRTGDLADLQQVIEFFQQAVTLTPENAPSRALYLNNLAIGLRDRYNCTGDLADLQQVIESFQQAVTLTPEAALDRATSLNNLALGLNARYKRTGDSADLQQAIESFQQAVALSSKDAPDRAVYLNNLASGLHDRYKRTGDLADFQQAIESSQQAVALTSEDAPSRAMYLHNLAFGLRTRYDRTGDLADLQQAIKSSQQAVALTSEDAPSRAMYLNNLALGLNARYDRTGDLADLQQAIESSQQAVALTAEDAPNWAVYLNNLAIGLSARYDRTEDLADLQQVIEFYHQAIALTAEDVPDRATSLNNLAGGLRARYNRTGDLVDLQQAIKFYQKACARGLNIASQTSLFSALDWKNWAFARQSWEEAEQASNYARQSIKPLLKIQLVRQSQESWLRDIQGLAADAAYAIAKTGNLESAIVAIEEGCARLLAEALERNRNDLEQLKELGHSDLYESYQDATLRLNQLMQVMTQQQPEGIGLSVKPSTEVIRQTKANLDSVINKIQQIPNYQDFLADPKFAEITEVVQPNKPLVYLMTTTAGSLALIVHKSVNGLESPQVKPIWLDEFTKTDLQKLLGYSNEPEQEGWFGSYKRYIDTQDVEMRQVARQKWLDTINRVTQALWTGVIAQVVQSLQLMGIGQAVLIPTGLFGFLPLHAAWTEDPNSPTGRRYALDAITLTYAPNARSLQSAYAIADQTQPISLLAVNQPRPVKASPLPSVDAEIQTAAAAFASSKELKHEQATLSNISAALKAENSVLHFACHGKVNFTEPLESGLLMANDEFFTLRELLNLRIKGARLAVLSACETGIPGEELPDEMVSLPSGLLQAGVAAIVASLWSVDDLATAMLLVRFYDLWRGKEKLEPHQALHRAQRWIRDTTNGEKKKYFKELKESKSTEVIPPSTARSLWGKLVDNPGYRDETGLGFANIYYWAAFNYVGV